MGSFKVNQKLFNEKGRHFGTPEVTLRDVIVTSLLAQDREDKEGDKDNKYHLFLRIAPLTKDEDVIELKAEEMALIKSAAKVHGPIIRGQIHDMVEGKFDPAPYLILKEYYKDEEKPEINMDVIVDIRKRLEEFVKILS